MTGRFSTAFNLHVSNNVLKVDMGRLHTFMEIWRQLNGFISRKIFYNVSILSLSWDCISLYLVTFIFASFEFFFLICTNKQKNNDFTISISVLYHILSTRIELPPLEFNGLKVDFASGKTILSSRWKYYNVVVFPMGENGPEFFLPREKSFARIFRGRG